MSEYLNDGGECVGEGGPDDGVLGGANEELPWFPLGQSPHWAQRLPHLDRQTDRQLRNISICIPFLTAGCVEERSSTINHVRGLLLDKEWP